MAERTGVFISYATRDGAAFAAGLRSALESEGVFVWQDVIQLPRVVGQEWWKRITDGIDRVNYLIMVLTPAAFERETVLQEWRYARRSGVCVIPVKASPEVDIQSLPRWMRKVQFAHLGDTPTLEAFRAHNDGQAWKGFVGQIFSPCEKPDYAFMVDKNDVYVPRAALSEQVIDLLLDREQKAPRAITSALRGAGGFGKTTLARAICFDDAVQDAFSDGILWVTLGESAAMDTVRVKLNALIEAKTHQRSDRDFESAKTRLRELLDGQEMLIVIDDVWKREHAEPFLRLGDHLTYLITTRMEDVLPHAAQRIPIAGMALAEAAALIGYGFPDEDKQAHAAELRTLAERLGEYALLLKLANGTLHDRVRAGEPLAKALDHLKRALEKRGITKAIQIANSDDRSRAVDATLRLSIERLSDREREWFKRLAIFPEDAVIPFVTLEKAWGCDDLDVEDGCAALNRLSLVLDYDLNARTITMHDIVRAYLREQVMESTDALKAANAAFLDAYGITHWRDLSPDEPYLWDWLAYHLLEASRAEELITTVLDLRYLAAKTFSHGTQTVEADIVEAAKHAREHQYAQADALSLLERNYRNMAHILVRCECVKDVLVTLHARLSHLEALKLSCEAIESIVKPFVTQHHPLPDLPHPALVRTLTEDKSYVNSAAWSPNGHQIVSTSSDKALKVWDAEAGVLLRTLTGHTDGVRGAVWSPDGRHIVSASYDKTLKVWDAEAGVLLRTLTGHTDGVRGAVWSPDGRHIVSASGDNTLKVWDAVMGAEIHTLIGHSDEVNSAAWSPDGRQIVSASGDNTLKVWDAVMGAEIHTLIGHSRDVVSATWSPDGRQIVSASYDKTLKVWDADTGAELRTLTGHTDEVNSAMWSPDGRQIVSASYDKTLKVWDADTGAELRTLTGHTSWVMGAAWSPDGRHIVSASYDVTLKVWDAESGVELHILTGHIDGVNSAAWSPNGQQMVSASSDETLKVWDVDTGIERRTLIGHTGEVSSAAWSPDGRQIVSASSDETIKVWDVETGVLLCTLTGHSDRVWSAAWSPDGRQIVSASRDMTIKLWYTEARDECRTLTGHSWGVSSAVWSPDGRQIVSASVDKTLKVWDVDTGIERRTLIGHRLIVTSTAWSPDGRQIVSGSDDYTLKVWSEEKGALLRTLVGHTHWVRGAAWSPDGRHVLSVSEDTTLRVWDAEAGKCRAIFYTDVPLSCCAWSPGGEHIVAGNVLGGIYWLRWVE